MNQAADLACELGIFLVGFATALADEGQQVLRCCQQLAVDLAGTLAALEGRLPVDAHAVGISGELAGAQVILRAAVWRLGIIAQAVQGRPEGFTGGILAVVDKHHLRLLPEAFEPGKQAIPVGVAGSAV